MRSKQELMIALSEEPTLSVEETSVLLGVARRVAYEAVRAGEIPVIKIRRRLLVPCTKLRALLGIERSERRLEPRQIRRLEAQVTEP